MYLVDNKEYLYWTISGDTEVGNCHTISLDGKEYSSTLFKGQVLLQLHLITKNRSDTSLAIPLPFQVNITKYSLGGQQSCLEQGMYLQNSQLSSNLGHTQDFFIRHHARFMKLQGIGEVLHLLLWNVKTGQWTPPHLSRHHCPQQFNLDLIRGGLSSTALEPLASAALCIKGYLVPPRDWQIHMSFHNSNASFRLFYHTISCPRTYSKSKQGLNVEQNKHYLNKKVFKETRLFPTLSPFGGSKFGWIESVVTSHYN